MKVTAVAVCVAGMALGLGASAHAQEVRTPQGERFQMGIVGGSLPDDPEYFWAHFEPPNASMGDSTTTSGIVSMMVAGGPDAEMVGSWTVDNQTGAVTIDPGFMASTHCETWPEYAVGETIDLSTPSEKNCWVGDNHAPYVHEMIYQGL
ncbi:hypothetical protein [Maricaulis maris]|uniref:hypothetical protein n=1 Tax=Maricaulis maris TaxID=74318 RepID=UPI003B8AFE08